jgi:hypothetical protein
MPSSITIIDGEQIHMVESGERVSLTLLIKGLCQPNDRVPLAEYRRSKPLHYPITLRRAVAFLTRRRATNNSNISAYSGRGNE